MALKHGIILGVMASLLVSTALADVKIGFIEGLSSNTGLSTLCGAEIVTEETNAVGGMSGERFMLVNIDTGEDVIEDVKAYECLAEAEEVDFTISGFIGDVSLG